MEDAPPKSSNGRAALLRRLAEQQLGPTGQKSTLPFVFPIHHIVAEVLPMS